MGIPAVFLSGCLLLASFAAFAKPDKVKPNFDIVTLSNRADLISGGNALVEVSVPRNVPLHQVKLFLNGTDITASFVTNAAERTMRGVVTGLVVGTNEVIADSNGRGNGRPRAKLIITNHPRGGPVLLGSQTQPWVCATPTGSPAVGNTPATNPSGLTTVAVDAQCNIATEYYLFYRTKISPMLLRLRVLPGPEPDRADAGHQLLPEVHPRHDAKRPRRPDHHHASVSTVPYIVRVERGTMNRGIYDIVVLFDPTNPTPWTALSPQPQWNGKVVYSFGASTGQPRLQFRTEQNWADDAALSRGFMVVDNSLTDSLYNSNRMLNAETTDDDEGAHRRHLRRDHLHDRQRLLGRIDPARTPRRLDLSRPARRHPAELRLPRFDHHRHRSRRLRAAGELLRGAGVGRVDDRQAVG